MRRLRITPAAEDDLDGIWAYIAKDNPSAADRFLRRLNDRMAGLPPMPTFLARLDALAGQPSQRAGR